MVTGTIEIVAALIRDDAGRVLLVRKRGTTAFMQPGGKRDSGEDDIAALAREIGEELGCCLVRDSIQPLGEFDAVSANEPGWRVRASLYEIDVIGDITPKAEIDAMVWIDPAAPRDIPLAPLTRDHVLPLASRDRFRQGLMDCAVAKATINVATACYLHKRSPIQLQSLRTKRLHRD